ncbi:hypothetical protein DK427_09065 [Methylobacterium radiodurans]|uniref:Uncharacterized protein n=1 Tax=Methylobacterium radiodurans TaxID=2202828 RepID=A0A2U8VRG1_9HYPH|nr:hypothetical protein DK427_09065 [Methylobacterium radiodurans]
MVSRRDKKVCGGICGRCELQGVTNNSYVDARSCGRKLILDSLSHLSLSRIRAERIAACCCGRINLDIGRNAGCICDAEIGAFSRAQIHVGEQGCCSCDAGKSRGSVACRLGRWRVRRHCLEAEPSSRC